MFWNFSVFILLSLLGFGMFIWSKNTFFDPLAKPTNPGAVGGERFCGVYRILF